MKINVTNQDGWKRVLDIELPKDKVAAEFDSTYKKYQSKAKISGFRPGKAPLEVVKSHYKDQIFGDVLESLLVQGYQEALDQTQLRPIGSPVVKDIQFEPGLPLKFTAEVEVQPEITVKDYKAIPLVKKVEEVKDEQVDQTIEYLREKNAELRPVEREAREKDIVIVDFEESYTEKNQIKKEKFENQMLELSEKTLLKDFLTNLAGLKIGEEKSFEITYPDSYPNPGLAGQKVSYKVKVKEIKEKILPFLNDDFAKSVGNFQTLLELRLKVRENIQKSLEQEAEKELKNQLAAKIVEKNDFSVPGVMLNSYLDYVVQEVKRRHPEADEKEIRERNKAGGLARIKWEFIFHQIAKQEKIQISQADIDERIKQFASAYNLPEDQARQYLSSEKRIRDLQDSIIEEKVLDLLLKEAKIKEEKK
ncbi:MAG: hypothetical protein RBG1_1C00001G1716 [candidate division Zixibacteria bacterium RBG-1]|nr:MAG: hypothetical protein RBG1_1C00001G1716 [candidate division Zixibacteria bacterium RBG-1]OGC84662.1 MAG: trigger factor [candidate division Zixibacteria bacterium RBG_19FT_COMBO_42_43]